MIVIKIIYRHIEMYINIYMTHDISEAGSAVQIDIIQIQTRTVSFTSGDL